MPLTNAGRDFLRNAVANNGSPVFFNNANARLCVGNGTTAFAGSQTDMVGASNTRRPMDSGYPDFTQGNNIIRFRATFGTGDANHAWDEWGVANAGSGGTLLNRKVEALGTKTSAQTWELTADITLNNP